MVGMKTIELLGLVAASLFVALLVAVARTTAKYYCARYGTYTQDVTMQLFPVGFGFGIGILTKRPVFWGAIISICGIVACLTVIHWFEAHSGCNRIRFHL